MRQSEGYRSRSIKSKDKMVMIVRRLRERLMIWETCLNIKMILLLNSHQLAKKWWKLNPLRYQSHCKLMCSHLLSQLSKSKSRCVVNLKIRVPLRINCNSWETSTKKHSKCLMNNNMNTWGCLFLCRTLQSRRRNPQMLCSSHNPRP